VICGHVVYTEFMPRREGGRERGGGGAKVVEWLSRGLEVPLRAF